MQKAAGEVSIKNENQEMTQGYLFNYGMNFFKATRERLGKKACYAKSSKLDNLHNGRLFIKFLEH